MDIDPLFKNLNTKEITLTWHKGSCYAYTNGFALQYGYIVQYVFSYMIIFKKILHLKKKNILMRYTKAKAIWTVIHRTE